MGLPILKTEPLYSHHSSKFNFVTPDFMACYTVETSRGKRILVREIGEFEKLGVKLQCLTEERERVLVRVIGRFEKVRVREIGIPL